jgi:hypothetical protein
VRYISLEMSPAPSDGLLLANAARIKSELRANDLDLPALIATGEISLLSDCELREDQNVAYTGPPLKSARMLFGLVHEGIPYVVTATSRLFYRYRDYDEDLAILNAGTGLSADQLVRRIRHGYIERRRSDKTKKSEVKRYGYTMVPQPHYGQLLMHEASASILLHWSIVDAAFQQALNPDNDAVVEIGCGVGHCLAQLAATSGRSDVAFFGAELSLKALACVQTFAELGNLPNLRPEEFDFAKPDFSFLRGFTRVLVISHGALMYGRNGSRDLWRELFVTVPHIRACLFEPVSFAIAELTEKPLFSRSRAEKYATDTEIYPAILELAQTGRIKLIEIVPDMTGVSINSSMTLLRWETAQ